MGSLEAESLQKGQVEMSQLLFGFVDSMALKCAVELGIADIINSHGGPITLSQIAEDIGSPSPDKAYLFRIMRFLVGKEVFTAHHPPGGAETLYGLNHNSRWLLRDSELNLGPLLLFQSHPSFLEPWHRISQCVKEGGIPFKRTHGYNSMWEFIPTVPELNGIFNEAMACTARTEMKQLLLGYKDGFKEIGTLMDVGGGIGRNLCEIVKANPPLKGINFDLPHVVAAAPTYEKITHVGGSMFESVPKADAIFMKRVLHDWGDEYCVRILKTLRKSLPKSGKLILAEIVLKPDESNDDLGLIFDLLVLAHTTGGKERTELEWKELLAEGGFPRYKIFKIPDLLSVIEAYPE